MKQVMLSLALVLISTGCSPSVCGLVKREGWYHCVARNGSDNSFDVGALVAGRDIRISAQAARTYMDPKAIEIVQSKAKFAAIKEVRDVKLNLSGTAEFLSASGTSTEREVEAALIAGSFQETKLNLTETKHRYFKNGVAAAHAFVQALAKQGEFGRALISGSIFVTNALMIDKGSVRIHYKNEASAKSAFKKLQELKLNGEFKLAKEGWIDLDFNKDIVAYLGISFRVDGQKIYFRRTDTREPWRPVPGLKDALPEEFKACFGKCAVGEGSR